jgi:hypothetical protein
MALEMMLRRMQVEDATRPWVPLGFPRLGRRGDIISRASSPRRPSPTSSAIRPSEHIGAAMPSETSPTHGAWARFGTTLATGNVVQMHRS